MVMLLFHLLPLGKVKQILILILLLIIKQHLQNGIQPKQPENNGVYLKKIRKENMIQRRKINIR